MGTELEWRKLADELAELLGRYGWLIQAHDNITRPHDVAAALARYAALNDGSVSG